MKWWRKLLGRKDIEANETEQDSWTEEELELHFDLKQQGLETVLGPMHNTVGHAIIPFSLGGAVDIYSFPQEDGSTAFASMELIQPDGTGSVPNQLGTYELVAFTRYGVNPRETKKDGFSTMEQRICGLFTRIGNFSFEVKLEPGETAEFPNEQEDAQCLIFSDYRPDGRPFNIGDQEHGLLLVIEVHKSEMDYARQNGTPQLIDKLKAAGYYPKSDLDRPSVV